MIDCSKDSKLIPYCLEGNTYHGTWGYPYKIDKALIRSYKNQCLDFLKKNKFI